MNNGSQHPALRVSMVKQAAAALVVAAAAADRAPSSCVPINIAAAGAAVVVLAVAQGRQAHPVWVEVQALQFFCFDRRFPFLVVSWSHAEGAMEAEAVAEAKVVSEVSGRSVVLDPNNRVMVVAEGMEA